MRELAARICRRLPVLIPLFSLVTLCFLEAVRTGAPLAALPWIVFAIALIVAAALASAWPIAEFLAIPFGRLYFPHSEVTPQPNYPLAEWYLERHRFEEAFREYDKILHYHPREIDARCLHIELLLARLDDPRRARRSFRRGLRLTRDPACRERIARAYAEALRRSLPES